LEDACGTQWFTGTPVEKHCPKVTIGLKIKILFFENE
jgi:hypothetical protein